jgi:hypothetical protein
VFGKAGGPCGLPDASGNNNYQCGTGQTCICTDGIGCECCQIRNVTLTCGTNIGTIGPTTACSATGSATSPFCAGGPGQCIGGQCCVL